MNKEIKITITCKNDEAEFDFKNGKVEEHLTLLWQAVRSISIQEELEPADVLSAMFHQEVQLKYIG